MTIKRVSMPRKTKKKNKKYAITAANNTNIPPNQISLDSVSSFSAFSFFTFRALFSFFQLRRSEGKTELPFSRSTSKWRRPAERVLVVSSNSQLNKASHQPNACSAILVSFSIFFPFLFLLLPLVLCTRQRKRVTELYIR